MNEEEIARVFDSVSRSGSDEEAAAKRDRLLALPDEQLLAVYKEMRPEEQRALGPEVWERVTDIVNNGGRADHHKHWSGPALMALADVPFMDTWRSLPQADKDALPEHERAQCVERFRKLTPEVDDTIQRLTRAQAKVEAKAKANASTKPRAREAPRFPRVWLDDAGVDLTSSDHVKGIIGRRSLVLVYGPSGDGKTFFTIDLLAHIAAAREWRGRRVQPCLCVYIAAEAGVSVLRRFVAWRDRSLSEGREKRIPLAIITRAANLLHVGDVEALIAELKAISSEVGLTLGIVAFDTFSRSTPGGDENAAADVTRAVAVADRLRDEFNASTVFVHHSGKDAAKGARGHSSLFAAADTVISVIEKVAAVEKSRDGLVGQQLAFRLDVVDLGHDEDGDAVTTCIVIPAGESHAPIKAAAASRLSGVAQVALQALREVLADQGKPLPETSSIPRGAVGVTLAQWRDRFALRYGKDGNSARDIETVNRAHRRGREALLRLKPPAVGISDPYCWAWKDK